MHHLPMVVPPYYKEETDEFILLFSSRWMYIPRGEDAYRYKTDEMFHLAIVMLGTPTRGTSVTVIWNNKYKS